MLIEDFYLTFKMLCSQGRYAYSTPVRHVSCSTYIRHGFDMDLIRIRYGFDMDSSGVRKGFEIQDQ